MLTRKSTATCAGTHDSQERHAQSAPRQHETHRSKSRSKVTARRGRTRLKPGKGPPGCLGSAGEDRMHAKLGSAHTAPPHTHPPPQAHTLTQVHASTPTAWQTTNEDISSSTRRRCRRGWTPKRGAPWVERGWTPLPFHCFAPADSTREVSTGRIGRAREVRVRTRAPHA